jgi:DNA-binding transcriptional regulator/RsmH inhibitor MraZ
VYGIYDHKVSNKGKILIPSKLRDEITQDNSGDPHIIFPVDECLTVFNPDQGKKLLGVLNDINLWDDEIVYLLKDFPMHLTYPHYKATSLAEKLIEINKIIQQEIDVGYKTNHPITGKDFEKLVRDILALYGFSVQLNVHILGAEVDLLMTASTSDGTIQYTIIECKNYEISNNKVEIRQVMSVFGLNEALKQTDSRFSQTMIINTTGFTKNSVGFAKLCGMSLYDFQGFLTWIKGHKIDMQRILPPIFKPIILNSRHEIKIPNELRHFLPSQNVTLVGTGSSFEIWDKEKWTAEESKAITPEDLTRLFLDLGI